MADKKITELTAIAAGSLSKDDVIPAVAVSGTPITKKISAGTLFNSQFGTGAPALSNVAFTSTSALPTLSLVKATLTANANANAAGVVTAGEFVAVAGNAAANTSYMYGLKVTSQLALGANVKTEHAAAKLVLDTGDAGALITNTYGLVISHANTGTRAAAPRAFICLTETVQSNTLSTQYLLELSQNGAGNVSANVFRTATNTTHTSHKLKIRVHGTDYWINLSSAV